MRSFAKINPRFWTPIGKTRQALRQEGPEALLLALYLQSCPMSNALGLYYLPLAVIVQETGLSQEEVLEALGALNRAGFAEYCPEEQVVWIPDMAAEQLGQTLKPQDHRVKWLKRELRMLEESRFYGAFLALYGADYQLLDVSEKEPDVPGPGAAQREPQPSSPTPPARPDPPQPRRRQLEHRREPVNSEYPGAPRGWKPPRRRPWDPPGPSPERMKAARDLDRRLEEAARAG